MKKLNALLAIIMIIHNQLGAVVKTFINNSSKSFLVRVYDNNNANLGIVIAPGDIHDLFIPCDVINKIVILDHKHSSKPLSAMTRHELRKEAFPINENMIFIINQNSSVKMYKGTTSRDKALREIDESYMKQAKIPTIELSIHTIKNDEAWTTQKTSYSLKHKTSFLGSIESLIS